MEHADRNCVMCDEKVKGWKDQIIAMLACRREIKEILKGGVVELKCLIMD